MLVVIDNCQYDYVDMSYKPKELKIESPTVIAIDPSKTNYALHLMTTSGMVLRTYEFSGNDRRRSPMDTTMYCLELQNYLMRTLKNVNIILFGAEATILTKKNNFKTVKTLQAVWAATAAIALQLTGKPIIPVNNSAWKSWAFPPEYNTKSDGKMSKIFMMHDEPDNPLIQYFEEDATDAYYVGKYLIAHYLPKGELYCNDNAEKLYKYDLFIHPINQQLQSMCLQYNEAYTLENNVNFYVNQFKERFHMVCKVSDLTLEQIYKSNNYVNARLMESSKVLLEVQRC